MLKRVMSIILNTVVLVDNKEKDKMQTKKYYVDKTFFSMNTEIEETEDPSHHKIVILRHLSS